jgi:hypothetical protein
MSSALSLLQLQCTCHRDALETKKIVADRDNPEKNSADEQPVLGIHLRPCIMNSMPPCAWFGPHSVRITGLGGLLSSGGPMPSRRGTHEDRHHNLKSDLRQAFNMKNHRTQPVLHPFSDALGAHIMKETCTSRTSLKRSQQRCTFRNVTSSA